MPAKVGPKKSAKSEDDIKKKETAKSLKKGAEEANGATLGNAELGSMSNGNLSASKTAAANLIRGTSQLATPLDEQTNKEAGISMSELSQHTDVNREGGENAGENVSDGTQANAEVKYEEPILPNLIVLRFTILKL